MNPWGQGHAFVDPNTGNVLGLMSDARDLLEVTKTLHKSFFFKLPGELVVDIVTGWGVISTLAGLYLWWPRRQKVWGVWLPRLRGNLLLVLRDLHTVPALYLAPIAVMVSLSGVLMGLSGATPLFGLMAARQLPRDILFPPRSEDRREGAMPIALDDVVQRFGSVPAHGPLSIALPADADAAYRVAYGSHTETSQFRYALLDQYSGRVLVNQPGDKVPVLGSMYFFWVFNEMAHLGTIWGMTGKILACLASLVLAFTSTTSWLMWWLRPHVTPFGVPKPVSATEFPRWAKATFVGCAVVMPLCGLTWLLIRMAVRLSEKGRRTLTRRPPARVDGPSQMS